MGVEFLFLKGFIISESLLRSQAFSFSQFIFFLYSVIYGLVREYRFVLFLSEFFRLTELSRR
jgi:hypothetical protein